MNLNLNAKHKWFEAFGTNLLQDSIILFIITPICLAGFILNLLSYLIILNRNKNESKPLFKHLKAYTINSSIMCLILTTYFTAGSYYFHELTNTFQIRAFGSYVFIPLFNLSYVFGDLLEIFISLRLILEFYSVFKLNNKSLTKAVWILLFALALALSFPSFLSYEPAYAAVKRGKFKIMGVFYLGLSEFSQSFHGKVLKNFSFYTKNGVVLGLQLIIVCFAFDLIVKHIRNKVNVKMLNRKQLKTMLSDMKQNGLAVSLNDFKVLNIKVKLIDEKIHRKTKLSMNLLYIVFVMSLFSVLGHAITIFFSSSGLLVNDACFYLILCLAVKNFFNFFAFSLLNKSFLNEFKGLIKQNV